MIETLLLKSEDDEVSYGPPNLSRWWILLLYSLIAISQGATWNIFAPVSDALELAYGADWGPSFIRLVVNVSAIVFVILLQPISLAIDRYGVRSVTLVSSTANAAACLLRYSSF